MKKSLSERRLVENQVYFRQFNERVTKGLDELTELAQHTDQTDLLPDVDQPIQFYCECSDDNCTKRITLRPSEHRALHKNNDQFVLLPHHDIPEIERITVATGDYIVVEKYNAAPLSVDKVHPTDLNHGK